VIKRRGSTLTNPLPSRERDFFDFLQNHQS